MTTEAASNDFFNRDSSRFSTLTIFFDHDASRDSAVSLEWLLLAFRNGDLLTRPLDFKLSVAQPLGLVGDFRGSTVGFDDTSSVERKGELILPAGFGCVLFLGLRDFRGDVGRVDDAAEPLGDAGGADLCTFLGDDTRVDTVDSLGEGEADLCCIAGCRGDEIRVDTVEPLGDGEADLCRIAGCRGDDTRVDTVDSLGDGDTDLCCAVDFCGEADICSFVELCGVLGVFCGVEDRFGVLERALVRGLPSPLLGLLRYDLYGPDPMGEAVEFVLLCDMELIALFAGDTGLVRTFAAGAVSISGSVSTLPGFSNIAARFLTEKDMLKAVYFLKYCSPSSAILVSMHAESFRVERRWEGIL